MSTTQCLMVACNWDGEALPQPAAALRLDASEGALFIEARAPQRGDPEPEGPGGGRLDALWTHEVVELFLLGADERYLELEWNPHGYWLALRLHGVRRVVSDRVPIEPTFEREGDVWIVRQRISAARLPPGLRAANAYAIYGCGEARRHRAHRGAPGDTPDFHRLETFVSLRPELLRALGPCGADWR